MHIITLHPACVAIECSRLFECKVPHGLSTILASGHPQLSDACFEEENSSNHSRLILDTIVLNRIRHNRPA